jgi:hypothetical protein
MKREVTRLTFSAIVLSRYGLANQAKGNVGVLLLLAHHGAESKCRTWGRPVSLPHSPDMWTVQASI